MKHRGCENIASLDRAASDWNCSDLKMYGQSFLRRLPTHPPKTRRQVLVEKTNPSMNPWKSKALSKRFVCSFTICATNFVTSSKLLVFVSRVGRNRPMRRRH
jgi:hypothetical protein